MKFIYCFIIIIFVQNLANAEEYIFCIKDYSKQVSEIKKFKTFNNLKPDFLNAKTVNLQLELVRKTINFLSNVNKTCKFESESDLLSLLEVWIIALHFDQIHQIAEAVDEMSNDMTDRVINLIEKLKRTKNKKIKREELELIQSALAIIYAEKKI